MVSCDGSMAGECNRSDHFECVCLYALILNACDKSVLNPSAFCSHLFHPEAHQAWLNGSVFQFPVRSSQINIFPLINGACKCYSKRGTLACIFQRMWSKFLKRLFRNTPELETCYLCQITKGVMKTLQGFFYSKNCACIFFISPVRQFITLRIAHSIHY